MYVYITDSYSFHIASYLNNLLLYNHIVYKRIQLSFPTTVHPWFCLSTVFVPLLMKEEAGVTKSLHPLWGKDNAVSPHKVANFCRSCLQCCQSYKRDRERSRKRSSIRSQKKFEENDNCYCAIHNCKLLE